MALLTYSEQLFEQYCNNRGYPISRIPTKEGERTPDYLVQVKGLTIVCEVTELTPNDKDRAFSASLEQYGMAGLLELAGRRILIKGKEKKDQLKIGCRDMHPGMLILCEPANVTRGYLNWDHFEASMYGHATRSQLADRVPLGHNFRGLCGPKNGRYFSALASLDIHEQRPPSLTIYHNIFAARPIAHDRFSCADDGQFFKSIDNMNGKWGWEKVLL